MDHSEKRRNLGYYRYIKIDEVKGDIHRMIRKIETKPNKIPVKFCKSISGAGVKWSRLGYKMLEEWRWSIMILLFKNKGDIQNYNNRGFKLLSNTVRVWERMMEIFFYALI